jgi:hypothetical protein
MIERFCIASKLTRFVQLTNVSSGLLEEFDEKLRAKIMQFAHIRKDAVRDLIRLPIKLGGLGIMSLSDIQHPALMATQYHLVQDPLISELLRKAGLLAAQDLGPGWETTALHMVWRTGRIVDFLSRWTDVIRDLDQRNQTLDQHNLWYNKMKDV